MNPGVPVALAEWEACSRRPGGTRILEEPVACAKHGDLRAASRDIGKGWRSDAHLRKPGKWKADEYALL